MTEHAPPPPPPKPRKSAAEKAQQSLDIANRKLEALNKRLTGAKASVVDLEKQIAAETVERDYFASHPALADTSHARQEAAPGTSPF